jgi:ech hydrogenase subunit D
MKEETRIVSTDTLVAETQAMKDSGYRMVTMSVVDLGDDIDLIYHFDKDLQLVHFRLTVPKETPVPSISPVYFMALLIENETKDHFGVNFDNLVLDFGGRLYLEDCTQSRPFCKVSVSKG